jgi:predicted PurR-regulated permease PerM
MALISDLEGRIAEGARTVFGGGAATLFGDTLTAEEIGRRGAEWARSLLGDGGGLFAMGLGAAALSAFFLSLVLLFYLLVSGPRLGRGLLRLIPPTQRRTALRIWAEVDPLLKRYFIGIAILITYAGVVAYIGLGLILDVPHAALLSIVTGLLEMVPVAGPIASAVVAAIVAFEVADSTSEVIAFVIYAAVLRLSIDQIVGPLVLGRAGRIHPVLVIFCFLAGGLLFGVAGVIMAVPVALTVRATLATVYREPRRRQRWRVDEG